MTEVRESYHHGDLRNALVRAGVDLAETGGPDAVTVRAAARAVGVSATAAYRHFADHSDLVQAVRHEAMNRLGRAIATRVSRDRSEDAAERLRAAGRGYVHFALAEPGLFRTAFFGGRKEPGAAPDGGPFGMLVAALDALVADGYLAADDRPLSEVAAWSAVHGLAVLMNDGPFRTMRKAEREAAIDRTLDVVVRGLATGPKARRRTAR